MPMDVLVGVVGTLLVLDLTRRCAGLALPIIAGIFLLYCVVGPWMPGVLQHKGIELSFLFSYVYSMEGVFGPTTAVSSTYIILFITFAAFLQVSKVGDSRGRRSAASGRAPAACRPPRPARPSASARRRCGTAARRVR